MKFTKVALEKDPLGCDEHSVSDGGCLGKSWGSGSFGTLGLSRRTSGW